MRPLKSSVRRDEATKCAWMRWNSRSATTRRLTQNSRSGLQRWNHPTTPQSIMASSKGCKHWSNHTKRQDYELHSNGTNPFGIIDLRSWAITLLTASYRFMVADANRKSIRGPYRI